MTIDAHGTFVYTPAAPMQPGGTPPSSSSPSSTADWGAARNPLAALAADRRHHHRHHHGGGHRCEPPQLSISDATATEPGTRVGAGYWHTSGNQILDAAGNPVQIAGVNWYGFEGYNGVPPDGLWTRNYKDMMDQIAAEGGFNTIRLPYSQDVLHGQIPGNSIDFTINPDLQGLTSIQVMDKIIDYAGQIGLKVILDHHRNDAGVSTTANGLWYDDKYSETDWVNDWVTLAARYAGTRP